MEIRIKRWRERRGYSVRTLAKRAGVGYVSIVRIEQGRMSPTVTMLEKLAGALGDDGGIGGSPGSVVADTDTGRRSDHAPLLSRSTGSAGPRHGARTIARGFRNVSRRSSLTISPSDGFEITPRLQSDLGRPMSTGLK